MTFFQQTERKTNPANIGTPSPCAYANEFKNGKANFGTAPFGSTQSSNRTGYKSLQKKEQNPQKDYEEVFVINDLTIKIKAQDQKSSVFKSTTERVPLAVPEQKPGPGQYQLTDSRLNKSKSVSSIGFHYKSLNRKPTVPSIPIDNLGFKEDDNNEMTKVKVPKASVPHPGSYELRTNLTAKGVLEWKAEKYANKQSENLPGPGQYNNEVRPSKSLSSCFISRTNRFGQAKKAKEQKMPGPGSYDVGKATKAKLSHNLSTISYFNSKVPRFQNHNNEDVLGPGLYFNENDRSKVHSVRNIKRTVRGDEAMSKIVSKQSTLEAKNTNPGPADYRTTMGMSYQLHKALLKKQVTNVLPKERRKMFQVRQDEINPGPGAYQNQQTAKMPRGMTWKPASTINLKHFKPEQEINPSPIEYNNTHNTIEQKIKKMNQKLMLTEQKPFNTGSERFKHYSNQNRAKISSFNASQQDDVPDIMGELSNKKVKRLVMTTIKVRVPFGVSSNKFDAKPLNYQGPDYYTKHPVWVKPTFNIKGKLQ